MTVDRNGLAALIEAVERGRSHMLASFTISQALNLPINDKVVGLVFSAQEGSLDAANALHEALLPGWGWDVASSDAAAVFRGNELHGPAELAAAANPARAWLLAILKALTAEGGE